MERDTPEGPACETGTVEAPTCDSETLADLAEMFGPVRLRELLVGLDAEIAGRLDGTAPGDPRLAGNAHALVSVSGTLGFPALSLACAELERACLEGSDPAEPLRRVREAAAQARRAIARLRTSPG